MFGGLLGLLAVLVVGLLVRAGFTRWRRRGDDLPALLDGAAEAGIITPDQHARILAYAATARASRSRLDGARWLGIIAGLFVAAGVSLLIATNWEDIGPATRVGALLVLLAAVGEGAIRFRDRALGLSLPLELVWLFLPLLGIGLYGQTFQLSGDPLGPFLLWLVLAAPLAWLSPRPVAATLHTFAMAAVLFAGNFVVEPAGELLSGATGRAIGRLAITDGDDTVGAWGLSLVLLAAIAVQSLRLLPRSHRHHFVGIVAGWLMCLLLAQTPLEIDHEGWLVLAALALSTAWLVVLAAMDTSFEERAPSLFVWLATIYALTFTWHVGDAAEGDASPLGIALVCGAVLVAVGGALLLPPSRLSPEPAWGLAAKGLLAAPVLVGCAFLSPDVRAVWLAALAMNLLLVAIAVGLTWHGSVVHDARQINLGVLVLVWVLITRFLDVFGSLLTSGVGFIVGGVLLAGLSWALERTRRRLIARPEAVS